MKKSSFSKFISKILLLLIFISLLIIILDNLLSHYQIDVNFLNEISPLLTFLSSFVLIIITFWYSRITRLHLKEYRKQRIIENSPNIKIFVSDYNYNTKQALLTVKNFGKHPIIGLNVKIKYLSKIDPSISSEKIYAHTNVNNEREIINSLESYQIEFNLSCDIKPPDIDGFEIFLQTKAVFEDMSNNKYYHENVYSLNDWRKEFDDIRLRRESEELSYVPFYKRNRQTDNSFSTLVLKNYHLEKRKVKLYENYNVNFWANQK